MPIAITHSARIGCRSITKVIRAINPAVIMLLLLRAYTHVALRAQRYKKYNAGALIPG